MLKRKQRIDQEAEAPSSSDESDSQDNNIVDVDFEFFDPAEIDFHGVKNLLRQLLDVDATLFDISALTNLVIEQKLLGSTVKVEGKEDDPYAFLTVLNLHEHKVNFLLLLSLVRFIKLNQKKWKYTPILYNTFISNITIIFLCWQRSAFCSQC